MDPVRLLLVEDESPLATPLARGLREEGYATDVAGDGRAAAVLVEATDYDLIVLDLGLPDGPGLELLRRWRAEGVGCPVLVLTAHDRLEDKVRGLDGGADDYLTKPFAFAELVARIAQPPAPARGAAGRPSSSFADVVLDRTRRRVERAGEPLDLTPKEFALLEFFMLHPGVVLDRNAIAEHVWDYALRGAHQRHRRHRRPPPPQAEGSGAPAPRPHRHRRRLRAARARGAVMARAAVAEDPPHPLVRGDLLPPLRSGGVLIVSIDLRNDRRQTRHPALRRGREPRQLLRLHRPARLPRAGGARKPPAAHRLAARGRGGAGDRRHPGSPPVPLPDGPVEEGEVRTLERARRRAARRRQPPGLGRPGAFVEASPRCA